MNKLDFIKIITKVNIIIKGWNIKQFQFQKYVNPFVPRTKIKFLYLSASAWSDAEIHQNI